MGLGFSFLQTYREHERGIEDGIVGADKACVLSIGELLI